MVPRRDKISHSAIASRVISSFSKPIIIALPLHLAIHHHVLSHKWCMFGCHALAPIPDTIKFLICNCIQSHLKVISLFSKPIIIALPLHLAIHHHVLSRKWRMFGCHALHILWPIEPAMDAKFASVRFTLSRDYFVYHSCVCFRFINERVTICKLVM